VEGGAESDGLRQQSENRDTDHRACAKTQYQVELVVQAQRQQTSRERAEECRDCND
jgi:hypothetical protein